MKRMRVYYSDYVKHMMYEFLTKDQAEELTDVQKQNNEVIKKVISEMSEIEKNILYKVYMHRQTIDGVTAASSESGMMIETLYGIVRTFEKKVAKERGLI